MANPIAELLIKLGVDDSEVDSAVKNTPGKFDQLGRDMSRKGAALSRNVTLPIVAAGAGLFTLAGKQEEAEAKLTSSFESMTAAGWTSIAELQAQASAFQEVTTFGDEGILEMQSVLLTFGNVTGDVFSESSALILDMSAKLGTDLQSSAIQVGKALNDPAKGLAMLNRVGVSFTDQQIEQVKAMQEAGDMAGAQAVILGELEKQFGGTAEAIAQTNSGKAKQAMNALGDAGEVIGSFVAPMVGKLAGWLKTLSGWFQSLSPEAQEWVVRLGAIAAAVGPVLFVGGKLIAAFGAIGKAFKALTLLMSANPWALLIAAVVALVVIIVKNWDKITEFLGGVWDWIKSTAGAVWDWLKNLFRAGLEFVKNLFLNWTGPGLLIKHWDDIKAATTAVKDWIVDKWNAVIAFFRSLPGKISDAVAGMWDGIKNAFRSAVNWVIDKWNNFSFSGGFNLPDIFGGGRVQIGFDTPNIPRLHDGGVFNAPAGRREGLALLEDGETVTPARGSAGPGGGPTITIGNVYGWDDFVRKVREAGVDINRLGWQA